MSFSVVFIPEAVDDVLKAYIFYKEIEPELADRLNSCIDQKVNLIQRHPKSSPKVYKNFRRCLLSSFPYALFYTIESSHIRFFGLVHQRQHFKKLLNDR